jgi:alpha-1,2-mannosyltransferase
MSTATTKAAQPPPATPRGLRLFSLTHATMMRWCTILLVQELCVFVFFVLGTHGLIVRLAQPGTTDYLSFYAAGHLANIGEAPLAYDRAAHFAAEEAASEPGIQYVFFFYPPVFLLLCSVLARLPYLVSFVVFQLGSNGLYLAAVRAILDARGWRWAIPVLSFPACFLALGSGQNAFLTAALFGGATFLLAKRPILAGVMFGLLCYKPHFGLLIPLMLIVGGCWRAIFAAAASVVAVVAVSVFAFGWATWGAFLHAMSESPSIYQSGRIPFRFFITPFGAARLMSIPPEAAYGIQIVASILVTLLVAWIWHRNRMPAIRGASLVAATLLAVPLALNYELVSVMIGMAWLASGLRDDGLRRWEKISFVAIYVISVSSISVATKLALPLGPIPAFILLAICVSRSLQYSSERLSPVKSFGEQKSSLVSVSLN